MRPSHPLRTVSLRAAHLSPRHPEPLGYTVFLSPCSEDSERHLGADGMEADSFRVHAGTRGRERARTPPQGLPRQAAEVLFERIVTARLAEGFVVEDTGASMAAPVPEGVDFGTMDSASAARAASREQALLQRLHPDYWRVLSQTQRNRLLWRIGEHRLTRALPLLPPLLGSGNPMQDYCLIWAVGRCAGGAAAGEREGARVNTLPWLWDIAAGHAHEALRRTARTAWMTLADEPARQAYVDSLVADWPARMREAWMARDEAMCLECAGEQGLWKRFPYGDWLEQLDLASQSDAYASLARPLLLRLLADVPLQYGTFRAVRHLYKAAEFRGDTVLFGLLNFRFETTKQTCFRPQWVYHGGRYRKFSDVAGDPELKFAYTDRTRNYLRRRTWRVLRRLAKAGAPEFARVALGVLLAFDDRNAGQARCMEKPHWDYTQRCIVTTRKYLGPYSGWMTFYWLLHSRGTGWRISSSDARSWFSADKPWQESPGGNGKEETPGNISNVTSDATLNAREEAFPELWDRQPQALLYLLEHSRCAGVHAFAARALAANAAFCATLSAEGVRVLLRSPYPATQRFAFGLVRERIDRAAAAEDALPWLLLSARMPLAEAHRYVLRHIGQNPSRYAANAELIALMLCAPDDEMRKLGRLLCEAGIARFGVKEAVVEELFEWLEDCEDWSGPLSEIAGDIASALREPLLSVAESADHARIAALLFHPCAPVAALAADWLLLHRQPVTALPADVLSRLLRDEDPAVCAVGMRLFGALPDAVLLQQPELFASFCVSAHTAVRQSAIPVLERLAREAAPESFSEFCAQLLPFLLDGLFRGESGEGVHADLLALFRGPLVRAANALDAATVRRLLLARSKGAQQLGASLLPAFPATAFSVRDWAAFACHALIGVRRWAQEAYRENAAAIEADTKAMEEALRIFDSRWDDSQEFARAFFSTHGTWTPALLVALCDHGNAAVELFGRDLIRERAALENIADYLLKLAQHPSVRIQELVSDWLESELELELEPETETETELGAEPEREGTAGEGYGEDNAEMLHSLRPYFLSVLSQVNRARTVKNRVLAFLRRQALRSPRAAAAVAEIFARQVVTVALADKAQYLEGLLAIRARYPELETPLMLEPVPHHADRYGDRVGVPMQGMPS